MTRERARACIADAKRPENSLPTRMDAAVMAAIFLESGARYDLKIAEYLVLIYEQPLSDAELAPYLAHTISLDKTLLSNKERK